jgi:hypothetical protein
VKKSVHRLLKLRHHKHTGKLLHHRHTSYRVLFLLMLVPPVFMLAIAGRAVSAEDYAVSAVVPAQLPAGAPVITSPANGDTLRSTTVTVQGTCPQATPAIIIALHDSSTLLGSSACRPDKTFALPVSLGAGSHTLTAVVTSITGQQGASSTPITITVALADTFVPPPLSVNTDSSYILFGPKTDAVWRGSFKGGTTPYTISINWGDTTLDRFTVTSSDPQTFTHRYDEMHSFDVKLVATDKKGASTQYHTAAVTYVLKTALLPPNVVAQTAGLTALSIEEPVAQVYVATLVPLTGMWMLEHRRLWSKVAKTLLFFRRK